MYPTSAPKFDQSLQVYLSQIWESIDSKNKFAVNLELQTTNKSILFENEILLIIIVAGIKTILQVRFLANKLFPKYIN